MRRFVHHFGRLNATLRVTAAPQNYTFASPDTQSDASACKRVVFLLTHRKKIDTFVVI